ncbi:hypothetical protein Tco_1487870, partial [Tanacetum coccineum]
GLESMSIWRIQCIGYGVLGFLGVETTHEYAISSLMAMAYWLRYLMSSNVIPDNVNVGPGGSNQVLQDVEHEEEGTGNDSNPAMNDVS